MGKRGRGGCCQVLPLQAAEGSIRGHMEPGEHSAWRAENLRGTSRTPATAGRWSAEGCSLALVPLLRRVPGAAPGQLGGLEAAAPAETASANLAPGVLTIVPPDRSADDAVQRGPLLEVTRGQNRSAGPRSGWRSIRPSSSGPLSSNIPRDIWCLEFGFKPPRRIDVDIPDAGLRMRRDHLVSRLSGEIPADGGCLRGRMPRGSRIRPSGPWRFQKPIRFLPHFVLESREGLSSVEGLTTIAATSTGRTLGHGGHSGPRRSPPAVSRHGSDRRHPLQPGEERWGVATWEAVDPRIDYFSIYVRGLTNATRWRTRPGECHRPG